LKIEIYIDKIKIIEEELNMEERRNGNTVLLTVIGVATMLVALVGATFAYFTATVNTTSQQTVSVTTKSVTALEYKSNGAISLLNAVPGRSANSTFTVENKDTSVAQSYDLTFKVDGNTFNNTNGSNQLLVTITVASTGANTPSLSGWTNKDYTNGVEDDAPIVGDQRINAGEKHTYTVTVNFAELNASQNANQGKSFSAHIEASDPKTLAS